MKPTIEILFSLIRNAVFGTVIDEETREAVFNCADKLYKFSKYHDVAHLVSYAIEKNRIPLEQTELTKKLKKRHPIAVVRYEATNQTFCRVCEFFEAEHIQFIPLKGSVIREFYPEPWMRTSCDIDILVHEEDLGRAVKLLQEKYSFQSDNKRDFHDVSLFSENGTHLELHFNIMENMKDVDTVLGKVWQYAKPCSAGSYKYELDNEFLIYHILAHMSYHILNGGSGIRSFIDLYLLEKNLQYDEKTLCDICREGGLLAFKTAAEKLAAVWLENKEHDDVTGILEKYILSGGTYGNQEAASEIKHVSNGGKVKYILTRIFQPYGILKEKYPVLRKHKWLLPVCQVRRWIYVLSSDRKKLVPRLFKAGGKLSKDQVAEKLDLLKSVGLDDK